jgi:pimeloyl-ACP methyl ester carboxylesterase
MRNMSSSVPPVIFVPGVASSPRAWDMQVAVLPERRCYAIDHTHLDSIASMAALVLATTAERFVLCGTSMGGYVALEVARQAPERIVQLILCNTNAQADSDAKKTARQKDIIAGADAYRRAREGLDHYANFVAAENLHNTALIERMRAISLAVGYETFVRHQQACMGRSATLSCLPLLKMPVLLIGGAEDRITPPEQQHEIASLIPQAQLHILPTCGHVAQWEQAAMVNGILRQFLVV